MSWMLTTTPHQLGSFPLASSVIAVFSVNLKHSHKILMHPLNQGPLNPDLTSKSRLLTTTPHDLASFPVTWPVIAVFSVNLKHSHKILIHPLNQGPLNPGSNYKSRLLTTTPHQLASFPLASSVMCSAGE